MVSKASYTLGEIAEYIKAELIGDAEFRVQGLNTLQDAVASDLSFLSNKSYQKYLATSQAGAVILSPEFQHSFSGNKLVINDPYYAFAQLTRWYAPKQKSVGIHSMATIGEECAIADDVSIAAQVSIGDNVSIGDGTIIGPGCVIGDNVAIGSNTLIHGNVSIYSDSQIGSSVIIHSQAVIGSDGFGFAKSPDGGWEKIYQLGKVIINDDVEIGAGTTIDRGALGNTVIGYGVKLDNQIQIAHNVVIGDYTAIAGATAIAGSTTIGKHCTIAGAVGIIGHLTIVDHVHVTAMTLVTKSITSAGSYSAGTPLNRTAVWRKNAARFNQLDDIAKRVNRLNNKD